MTYARVLLLALPTSSVPLFSLLTGAESQMRPRIVGGEEATANEHPDVVAIFWRGHFFCGGTLIAPDWVITAAHCVEDGWAGNYAVSSWRHTLSTPSGAAPPLYINPSEDHADCADVVRVAEVISHPDYNEKDVSNDIALIRLQRTVKCVERIPLAILDRDEQQRAGEKLWIAGWGALYYGRYDPSRGNVAPGVMHEAAVDRFGSETCSELLCPFNLFNMDCVFTPGPQMCAGKLMGGVDACSGGPLFRDPDEPGGRPVIVGITSWGYGCAEPATPGVYTRITHYRPWILAYIGCNEADCPPALPPLPPAPPSTPAPKRILESLRDFLNCD